ncbi:proteasome assembly chaperone 1 [Brachionus plicatilis]|uniref:Proteasome assembly chaperone 1 n=1 Tax=Brachionus plicatilis TaxID=10195 RepID=A0A3M7RS64_BRAPC|nr:proteasome assembly chaperone 1 [Brachionus plicatilis]
MSLFGELQFGFSRAVSDDEDDEFARVEPNLNFKRKIQWLEESTEKIEVDELILADGPISCAFLHVYLLNHLNESEKKLLGLSATNSEFKVFQNDDKTDSELNRMRKNLIYKVDNLNNKSYLVCEVFTNLKSNEFYDWIDQLWERVNFKACTILCSQNQTSYFSSNRQEFPCVKYLSSNKEMATADKCQRLEEPNFLQNLPAAMIQFCVLKKLEFTAFVCYSPSINVDIQSVKETFSGVSGLLKDKNIFKNDDLSKKCLLNVGNLVNSVSGLYM